MSSIHTEGFGLSIQNQVFQSHMDIRVSFFPFLSLFLPFLLHFAAHQGLEHPGMEPTAQISTLQCKDMVQDSPTRECHTMGQ